MLQTNWTYEGFLWSKITGPKIGGIISIIGRSIAIYSSPDDYGTADTEESLENGSKGIPIGCCTIERIPQLSAANHLKRAKHDKLEDDE